MRPNSRPEITLVCTENLYDYVIGELLVEIGFLLDQSGAERQGFRLHIIEHTW
jgi:hypothetical protein